MKQSYSQLTTSFCNPEMHLQQGYLGDHKTPSAYNSSSIPAQFHFKSTNTDSDFYSLNLSSSFDKKNSTGHKKSLYKNGYAPAFIDDALSDCLQFAIAPTPAICMLNIATLFIGTNYKVLHRKA